ncbi:hypothetical protein D9M68_597840 [compost metagenome]
MNEQGFLRLVIESDVQIPVDIDNFFGLSPPNQRLSPSHGNDGIGLVIDRNVLQCFSASIQPLRTLWCPVFGGDVIRHGADFGVRVQPKNHLGIVTVSKLLVEVRLLNFPADLLLAHVANDCPPISTLLIEICHLVVGLLVSDIRHELGITKGGINPRQPANELERHCWALVLIMNGGDFELRQIKAFAKHVDADDDPVLLFDDLRHHSGLVRHLAVNQDWREVGVLLVNLKQVCRPLVRLGPNHHQMVIACLEVSPEQLNSLVCDGLVGQLEVVFSYRMELDAFEIAIKLRIPERVVVDDLAGQS